MKIALACVGFMPQNVGRQPWYYFDALFHVLIDLGHEAWVLTDQEGQWPDGRRTLIFPGFRAFPRGVALGLGSLLAEKGIDAVIWSTGASDFFFWRGVTTLKIPVIAVVTAPKYTLRELFAMGRDLLDHSGLLRHFGFDPLIRPERVQRFLASPYLKGMVFQTWETLERFIPQRESRRKTGVIPPPIPGEFSANLAEMDMAGELSRSGSFTILYFGPPVTIRGIDTVVAAMARVAGEIKGVRLKILSRTEHPHLLDKTRRLQEHIRRAGLAGKTEVVIGVLSRREVALYLGRTDVICLPFKGVVSDAPIAVLEALASGRPLITTRMTGLSEFAQNSDCLLIPPGDAPALADAILSIHRQGRVSGRRNPLAKNLGQDAFKAAWKNFLQKVF